MKNALRSLWAMPLAILLVFGFACLTPALVRADEAAASDATTVDNPFVDGNWFQIAADKGESYKEGSPTNEALNAQIAKYKEAEEAGDTAQEEHFAIRSWVKGWCAAEAGRQAYEAKDYAKAKKDFSRAKKLGVKAQGENAGRGQKATCGNEHGPFGGCSAEEGADVVTYCERWLKKIAAKTGNSDE